MSPTEKAPEVSLSSSAAADATPQPLLLALPEDVLGLISLSLHPSDLCSLILSCRALRSSLSSSDKVWLPQCLRLASPAPIPPPLLHRWRASLPSYRSLCRFLSAVSPLLGTVWVHQNPELGNVVCVLPGFLSVVGCRVIPQELGPLGLHQSPLLYTPVFEILAAPDGSISAFFLHGRDASEDSIYPGSIKSISASSNVLFLEVDEPVSQPKQHHHRQLSRGKSFVLSSSDSPQVSSSRRLCRSDTTIPRSPLPEPAPAPFSRLAFKDRRKLLELVAGKVRLKVPADLVDAPLFDQSYCGNDIVRLAERWAALLRLHKTGWGCIDRREARLALDSMENGRSSGDCRDGGGGGGGDGGSCSGSPTSSGKRRSFTASVSGYVKQILGKGSSSNCHTSSSGGNGESKHVQLQDFLRPRDAIGLSLRAANVKLSTYRAWPNMHDNRFSLYKLPMQVPTAGREYAGIWGGTFGWPPGQASEDKPGKALFFLLLSYEEEEGNLLLIATKILEGTHYVLHPNGSAMFIVKVDEPSSEPFPWETDGSCQPVEVKQSFSGDGIANGYGFRYPGSKPGSLYMIQDGRLAFVWSETKAVLTLQRLDLQELLRKGERVAAPPPVANFVYLTKSYSNVFAGFANNANSSQAPRSCY